MDIKVILIETAPLALSCGRSETTASFFSYVKSINPLTHLIRVHSVKRYTNQTVILVLRPLLPLLEEQKIKKKKKNPNVFIALASRGTC